MGVWWWGWSGLDMQTFVQNGAQDGVMRVGKERSYGRELRTEHPAGEFRLKLNTNSAINTESPIEINTKKVTTATSHNSELIFILC